MILLNGRPMGKALLGLLVPVSQFAFAQGLPALPQTRPLNDAPTPAELLPLRPYVIEGESNERVPFTWRGERVKESDATWELEQGAIQGQGILLLADHIRYDINSGDLVAEGHIRLEGTELRLRCEKLTMNWNPWK
jgi:hypothetical protein